MWVMNSFISFQFIIIRWSAFISLSLTHLELKGKSPGLSPVGFYKIHKAILLVELKKLEKNKQIRNDIHFNLN